MEFVLVSKLWFEWRSYLRTLVVFYIGYIVEVNWLNHLHALESMQGVLKYVWTDTRTWQLRLLGQSGLQFVRSCSLGEFFVLPNTVVKEPIVDDLWLSPTSGLLKNKSLKIEQVLCSIRMQARVCQRWVCGGACRVRGACRLHLRAQGMRVWAM